MARFEVYSKTINIEGDDYKLYPLSGEYLGKFYEVIGKLESVSRDETVEIPKDIVTTLHELLTITFKEAYPEDEKMSSKAIEQFVTRHLWTLVPVLSELNIKTPEENAG